MMSSPRAFHSATALTSGKVLLAGGKVSNSNTASGTADLFAETVPVELQSFSVE
jgi:hypothetical protein